MNKGFAHTCYKLKSQYKDEMRRTVMVVHPATSGYQEERAKLATLVPGTQSVKILPAEHAD